MKCKICGNENFIYNLPGRDFRVCSQCYAMERHRALWEIMSGIIKDGYKVLEIAPLSKCIFGDVLKEKYKKLVYVGMDKYRQGNPLDKRDVSFCDVYCDLSELDLKFKQHEFNIVIMQHVLEEIENYKICLKKIRNVMSKNAVAFLEIPCCDNLFEHIKQNPDKHGNVWKFSTCKLLEELRMIFANVETIEYNECEFKGKFFVCESHE